MTVSLHPSCVSAARCLAVALCMAGIAVEPAPAHAAATSAACGEPESLTRLQRRLLAKADEGIEPLRQYIHITRRVHELDLHEVVHWMDRRRARLAACLALAEPTQQQATAVPARPR